MVFRIDSFQCVQFRCGGYLKFVLTCNYTAVSGLFTARGYDVIVTFIADWLRDSACPITRCLLQLTGS